MAILRPSSQMFLCDPLPAKEFGLNSLQLMLESALACVEGRYIDLISKGVALIV